MSELSLLMAKDPLELTKDDRSQIIAYLRDNRSKFLSGAKTAGKAPKAPKPTGPVSLADFDL